MIKKIVKVILLVLTLVLFSGSVNALETSFTKNFKGFAIDFDNALNRNKLYSYNYLPTDSDTMTFFKISSQISSAEGNYADGKMLYCADGKKLSPSLSSGAVDFNTDCHILKSASSNYKSIAYIFENGFGTYKTDYSATDYLTGTIKKDYYITQAAIWHFTVSPSLMKEFDFKAGTFDGKNTEITKKISKLILDAEAAADGASLKIELSNNKMSLTEDGKYYITDPIKLVGKFINSQITTELTEDTSAFVAESKDATSGTTKFNNNSTVYIKLPVESLEKDTTINLNISATTSIEQSEAIQCDHPQAETYDLQPVIIFYPKNSELKDSVAVTAEIKSYEVKISKRSITGSDELPGAKLKITDKEGNVVKDLIGNDLEWVSGNEEKLFQLKAGDYVLSETIAPEGYELSETTIEFTISNDGNILVDGKSVKDNLIIFENTPEPKQVPTGSTVIYIASSLAVVTLGIAAYFILKKRK